MPIGMYNRNPDGTLKPLDTNKGRPGWFTNWLEARDRARQRDQERIAQGPDLQPPGASAPRQEPFGFTPWQPLPSLRQEVVAKQPTPTPTPTPIPVVQQTDKQVDPTNLIPIDDSIFENDPNAIVAQNVGGWQSDKPAQVISGLNPDVTYPAPVVEQPSGTSLDDFSDITVNHEGMTPEMLEQIYGTSENPLTEFNQANFPGYGPHWVLPNTRGTAGFGSSQFQMDAISNNPNMNPNTENVPSSGATLSDFSDITINNQGFTPEQLEQIYGVPENEVTDFNQVRTHGSGPRWVLPNTRGTAGLGSAQGQMDAISHNAKMDAISQQAMANGDVQTAQAAQDNKVKTAPIKVRRNTGNTAANAATAVMGPNVNPNPASSLSAGATKIAEELQKKTSNGIDAIKGGWNELKDAYQNAQYNPGWNDALIQAGRKIQTEGGGLGNMLRYGVAALDDNLIPNEVRQDPAKMARVQEYRRAGMNTKQALQAIAKEDAAMALQKQKDDASMAETIYTESQKNKRNTATNAATVDAAEIEALMKQNENAAAAQAIAAWKQKALSHYKDQLPNIEIDDSELMWKSGAGTADYEPDVTKDRNLDEQLLTIRSSHNQLNELRADVEENPDWKNFGVTGKVRGYVGGLFGIKGSGVISKRQIQNSSQVFANMAGTKGAITEREMTLFQLWTTDPSKIASPEEWKELADAVDRIQRYKIATLEHQKFNNQIGIIEPPKLADKVNKAIAIDIFGVKDGGGGKEDGEIQSGEDIVKDIIGN